MHLSTITTWNNGYHSQKSETSAAITCQTQPAGDEYPPPPSLLATILLLLPVNATTQELKSIYWTAPGGCNRNHPRIKQRLLARPQGAHTQPQQGLNNIDWPALTGRNRNRKRNQGSNTIIGSPPGGATPTATRG